MLEEVAPKVSVVESIFVEPKCSNWSNSELDWYISLGYWSRPLVSGMVAPRTLFLSYSLLMICLLLASISDSMFILRLILSFFA